MEILQSYILDTLYHVDTVNKFCHGNPKWTLQRQTELDTMMAIQERVNQLNIDIGHVSNTTNKGKAIGEYLEAASKRMLHFGSTREQLETELATVLGKTVAGMEKLSSFLDVLEKLASTSLPVFTGGDEVLKLSLGVRLQRVEDSISAARLVCPLLLQFKRDAGTVFSPSLNNVDVFVTELSKYIRTTEKICTRMEKR